MTIRRHSYLAARYEEILQGALEDFGYGDFRVISRSLPAIVEGYVQEEENRIWRVRGEDRGELNTQDLIEQLKALHPVECDADIRKMRSSLACLRFHDLRHTAATKLLEYGTPFAVVAQILGWAASTAVRMAKRYGHIRPEVQWQALDAVATAEIQLGVNQIVHQAGIAIISERLN